MIDKQLEEEGNANFVIIDLLLLKGESLQI
jgi:hypothetical protein